MVLSITHNDRRQTSKHRHDPRQTAVFNRNRPEKLGSGRTAIGNAVNDIDQAKKNNDLNGERDEAEHRVVMLFFIKSGLAFSDSLSIAEISHLYVIKVRHELNHDDRVFLHPQSHGHKHDFDNYGEQQNGQPPVLGKSIARAYNQGEQISEILHSTPSSIGTHSETGSMQVTFFFPVAGNRIL